MHSLNREFHPMLVQSSPEYRVGKKPLTMKINPKKRFSPSIVRKNGFSMLELVIVMAVMLIVTAVGLPSFFRALRTYQLNDTATQVASVIKFTRYQAIRNATTTSSLVRPGGAGACPAATLRCIWTDSNGNLNLDGTENQVRLTGSFDLIAAGTPPGGLAAAVGAGALTNVSLAAGSVSFDRRGAVAPAAVDVLYVGSPALPSLGYRAVVLLPSGSIQIWTTDTTGRWRQVN